MTRQMLSCAPRSKITDTRIAKPKLAPSCAVKTAVWVRKPGPIADVAMRNAAPTRMLRRSRGAVGAVIRFGGASGGQRCQRECEHGQHQRRGDGAEPYVQRLAAHPRELGAVGDSLGAAVEIALADGREEHARLNSRLEVSERPEEKWNGREGVPYARRVARGEHGDVQEAKRDPDPTHHAASSAAARTDVRDWRRHEGDPAVTISPRSNTS